LLDNSSLRIFCTWLLALRNHINTFYNSALFFYQHLENLALGTFVLTGIHINSIAFFDM